MPIAQMPTCRDCPMAYRGVPWWEHLRVGQSSRLRLRCSVTGRWVTETAVCTLENRDLLRIEARCAATVLARGEHLGVKHCIKVAEDDGLARYREIELDKEPAGAAFVFWRLKGR